MKKITIVGEFSFSDEQMKRLEAVGDMTLVPDQASSEAWLGKVEGADVICSDGDYLLENLEHLKDVFVTYPFIELGEFDSKKLAGNGVTVANTQGSNRDSIVEWAMFMTLSLLRKFPSVLNVTDDVPFELAQSLHDKRALIIGKGSIGSQIGELCKCFGMDVDFYTREDDLAKKSADADVAYNCLNCNSSSKNLLDEAFFMGLKKGAYYISFVRQFTYDLDGLIASLENGILAGAAIDCDPEAPGNTSNEFYQKVLEHEKILATPHIAFATEQASKNGKEIVVKNIEAHLSGKPQNVLTK